MNSNTATNNTTATRSVCIDCFGRRYSHVCYDDLKKVRAYMKQKAIRGYRIVECAIKDTVAFVTITNKCIGDTVSPTPGYQHVVGSRKNGGNGWIEGYDLVHLRTGCIGTVYDYVAWAPIQEPTPTVSVDAPIQDAPIQTTTTSATTETIPGSSRGASITLDQARAVVSAVNDKIHGEIEGDNITIRLIYGFKGRLECDVTIAGITSEVGPINFASIESDSNWMMEDGYSLWLASMGDMEINAVIRVPISDAYVYEVRVWDPITRYNQTEYTRYSVADAMECVDNLREGVQWAIVRRVHPCIGSDDEPVVIVQGIRGVF